MQSGVTDGENDDGRGGQNLQEPLALGTVPALRVCKRLFIDQECSLIIGVGSELAPALTSAAQTNTSIKFALIDSTFQASGSIY